MRRKLNKNLSMHEMNVVPFIDILFVLLIIFMATSPQISQGINVKLPVTEKTKEIKQEDVKELMVLSINKDGDYYMEEQKNSIKITISEFITKIEQAREKDSNVKIFIRADEETLYKNVVFAMAKIKKAGFPEVGLVTEVKDN